METGKTINNRIRSYLNYLTRLQSIAFYLITISTILFIWVIIKGDFIKLGWFEVDLTKATTLAPFVSGVVMPFISIASVILLFVNFNNWNKQQFSTTFFQMISLHNKIIDGINTSVYDINTASSNRTFFDDVAFRIAIDFNNQDVELMTPVVRTIKVSYNPNSFDRNRLIDVYEYYFHIHNSDLGHYFRNLYQIIKYIDNSNLGDDEKKQYIGILRAQLSNSELILITYNCMHSFGEKLRPYIIKYSLVKNLNFEFGIERHGWKTRLIKNRELIKQEFEEQLKISYENQKIMGQNIESNFS